MGVFGKSHQDFHGALDSHYRNNFVNDSPVMERKHASDISLRESDKVVGDNISNNIPSYTKDKYTGVWLRHELPYSQVFTDDSDLKKIAHNKAIVGTDENDGLLIPGD